MKKKMTQRHLELLIEIYADNGTKTAKEICGSDELKQKMFIDLLDAKCIYIDKNKIVTVNRRYEFELAEKLQYQQVLKDAPQEEEHEQDWIIRMNYTSKESKERHERYLRRLENVEKLHERQAQQEEEEYKKSKGW